MTVFDDLAAEQERLEGILGGLDEAQWMSASGAAGWTVADVVLHLAQSEESVVVSASGGDLRTGPGRTGGGTERSALRRPSWCRGAGGIVNVAAWTLIVTGSYMYRSASILIGPGIVALNSAV